MKTGECLVGLDMKPEAVGSFRDNPRVRIVISTPLSTAYLALNTQRRFLDDVRLRQAMWMAIDKKTYIETVFAGLARPAASFLPPGIWSHDTTLKDRRDPVQARKLVKESGYDGSELVMFFAPGNDRLRTAQLLQSDWAKVGIRVRLLALETGELFKRAGSGEHDVVLLAWYGDNGDPDNFFTPNLSCAAVASGGNKARWCDRRFDALLAAARRTTDVARRRSLYVQAQRLLHEQASIIPLAYGTDLTAVNTRVRGFVASPFAVHDFRGVSLD
jgi:dipeptide transport system substrate-binding protein